MNSKILLGAEPAFDHHIRGLHTHVRCLRSSLDDLSKAEQQSEYGK